MLERVNYFVHKHLLSLLIFMYMLACLFPQVGIQMRCVNIGKLHWSLLGSVTLSLPLLMLSLLLFNAGFCVDFRELKKVFAVPTPLILGVAANTCMPLVFTGAVAVTGQLFWHNSDEIQNLLVGLAIIASMPIAGSSTTWAQNSNGNIALILGLVVISTILSPLLSPLVFHAVGLITKGDFSEDLHELATQGTSGFLIVSVVIPSLLGIATRHTMNEQKFRRAASFLRTVNLFNLLILNYSNASTSLPIALKNPDYDFLILVGSTTLLLCVFSFCMGWFLPKMLKLPKSNQIALTFGLGMNNNGTGLVLVSAALPDHPFVMLPIIFYNLGQQIVAGTFNTWILRKETESITIT